VGGEFRPNPGDPCGCPICVLNMPDAGVTKDARVPDSGPLCGPIACPMLACVNGYLPNPEPCGCPTCAPPDAGVAKDAGRADTQPICEPISCPAIACVSGTHPNPDPCGCPLCGPAPDAAAGKDAVLADGPPTACPMLASLNPADAAQVGYTAGREFLRCNYAGGTIEDCISSDAIGCPGPVLTGGNLLGCSNLCTASEYGLSYGGVGPSAATPSIDLPVGCRLGLQTPAGVAFYCCPCGT
jgi:hypothetical protein